MKYEIPKIKCDADERRRRGLDRAEPLFLPIAGQKCKRISTLGIMTQTNLDTRSSEEETNLDTRYYDANESRHLMIEYMYLYSNPIFCKFVASFAYIMYNDSIKEAWIC